jgi:hypothetical protein
VQRGEIESVERATFWPVCVGTYHDSARCRRQGGEPTRGLSRGAQSNAVPTQSQRSHAALTQLPFLETVSLLHAFFGGSSPPKVTKECCVRNWCSTTSGSGRRRLCFGSKRPRRVSARHPSTPVSRPRHLSSSPDCPSSYAVRVQGVPTRAPASPATDAGRRRSDGRMRTSGLHAVVQTRTCMRALAPARGGRA